MKSTVKQSTFSFLLTMAVMLLLGIGCWCTYGTDKFVLVWVLTLILLVVSMFYMPMYISAEDKEVCVHSPFKIHSIPMRRIVSVERFQPTIGSIRICGSGGFMGYWGIFREGDVGKYTAYYGRASECFIIRLDNGDKYVLGCTYPDQMVQFIQSQI